VRDFLLKELRMASNLSLYQKRTPEKKFDHKNFVRVPVADVEYQGDRNFKTFKIVRK